MNIKVGEKTFTDLKEAQEYAASLKAGTITKLSKIHDQMTDDEKHDLVGIANPLESESVEEYNARAEALVTSNESGLLKEYVTTVKSSIVTEVPSDTGDEAKTEQELDDEFGIDEEGSESSYDVAGEELTEEDKAMVSDEAVEE